MVFVVRFFRAFKFSSNPVLTMDFVLQDHLRGLEVPRLYFEEH